MAEGNKVVVYAALGGNLAVATIKFIAFGLTGATAMLTEGIHSVVDTGDQALLLIGLGRSGRPADKSHPFGYGMELYFWSFVVALLIFMLGGAVSLWQGVDRILHPQPAETPWINYLVLGLSFVFEGISFVFGWREYKRVAPEDVGVVRFIRRSKDPTLFTSLLEDSAALTGLVIAALGVAGGHAGIAWADGAASIGIGVLLMGVALVLGNETRSLIAGEAAAKPVVERVRRALESDPRVAKLGSLRTLHLGPGDILVAADLRFAHELDRAAALDALEDLTAAVRDSDPRVTQVFLRPMAAAAP